jgi:glutamyl/glutaminyl-tRNA synthetase
MITTRFNPSCNGDLHLGHLFTLLVNEHFSHSTGGKFYVRLDDVYPKIPKECIDEIAKHHIRTITALDIPVDGWERQSKLMEETYSLFEKTAFFQDAFPEDDIYPKLPIYVSKLQTTWLAYPYVPRQTLERVYQDYRLGITHVIRGEEFATEYSLYHYFCYKLRINCPNFIYLPRLIGRDGDISKTAGGYTIRDFLCKGYSSKEIKDMVAKACLILPANGWDLWNIKKEPRIDL